MIKLNLHQVKAQFSKYIEIVEGGEIVVVCKRNEPVAEIRPISKKKKKVPQLGWADGMYKRTADLDKLSREDLLEWEGDRDDPLRKYAPKRPAKKK